MAKGLEIRQFDVREADWAQDGPVLSEIRRQVFIVEQSVPQEEEWDGRDEESWHWLATDSDGKPIGTARLLPEGQIGRMAVLADYRSYGVGAAMLEAATDKAARLGFASVYLNAQSHALGFYERAGYVAEGEEFMEAGIPHRRMTRNLLPQDDAQRVASGMRIPDVAIRSFDTAEANWPDAGETTRKLREAVFVEELGLPAEMVADSADEDALHWCAQSPDGQIIGAVRMDTEGHVSRLVVDSHFRRMGVGRSLVELTIAKARRFGLPGVSVQALAELDDFYSGMGFIPVDEPYESAGLQHRDYEKPLEYEDVHEPQPTAASGTSQEEQPIYGLGVDDGLILLRKEEEFRNIILEMCRQATQSVRIYSPLLEHKLFDSQELMEILSELARRNRHTRVEILVYDPHRMIKNGHALLEISRKLPSSIGIKIVDPELRQLDHEYVLVDSHGYIYRRNSEVWDGYANFNDLTECNRLGRAFKAAWQSGQLDPNLRRLRL